MFFTVKFWRFLLLAILHGLRHVGRICYLLVYSSSTQVLQSYGKLSID
jgi:hypothetical protein